MPFASINPNNPRSNLWDFGHNCSAFAGSWKTQFFWFGHFEFFTSFLLKFITNQWVPRMGWNFDDYPLCSTLNSWIGELVVSFLDVTTRLLEGKECLKLKSFGRKFLPFNAWTVNMEFGGPFTIKFWKKRSNTNNESIYWHLEWDKLKNTFDKPSYSQFNPVWIFPPFLDWRNQTANAPLWYIHY